MGEPHESTSNEARDLDVDGRAVEMELYISSKHLTDVSPYFDTSLNGGLIKSTERNLQSPTGSSEGRRSRCFRCLDVDSPFTQERADPSTHHYRLPLQDAHLD